MQILRDDIGNETTSFRIKHADLFAKALNFRIKRASFRIKRASRLEETIKNV